MEENNVNENKNILKKKYYRTKNRRMGPDNTVNILGVNIPMIFVMPIIYGIIFGVVLIPVTIYLSNLLTSELVFGLIYSTILGFGIFLILARFWFVAPYTFWAKNYSDIEKHISKVKQTRPDFDTDNKIVIRKYDDWFCVESREIKEMTSGGKYKHGN